MNKPKLTFVIDSLQTGGAEMSLYYLASGITKFEISFIVLYSDKDHLRRKINSTGTGIVDLNLNRDDKLWFIRGRKPLQNAINKLQPNILHAHLFKSELLSRIIKLPTRTILIGAFVNDSYSKERYNSQSFIRNLKLDVIKWADRLTINRNKYVTSLTKAIKNSNGKALKYPLNKIKVIYRGRNINKVDNKYEYDSTDIFKFLAVGRLLERKGYIELLNAVKLLAMKGIKFQINIAGDGADKEKILKLCKSLKLGDYVNFLGYTNKVNEYLASSHCFVFASHYEGQGGALVEAMMQGIPIITSDIEVFKEQVTDRYSAILFKTKDANDLAVKMEWVINNYDKAKEIGLNAKIEANKNYNLSKIIEDTENFYLEILE